MRDILTRAAQLSRSERKELIARIKALDASGLTVRDERSHDEDLVLAALAQFLRDRRVEFSGVAALRQSAGPLREGLPALMQFIKQAQPTRAGQYAMLLLGIELLYDNLIKMNVPVSGRLLVNHLPRLPSVVNAAFPGYAEAGMLSLLIRKELT